jgi:hypothetical protein
MSRFAARATALLAIGLTVAVGQSGVAFAGGPGVWTKIGVTTSGFNQATLFRTADGRLHMVWLKRNASTSSYASATISLTGKLLGIATALSNWTSLEGDPRLVATGSGLRLVWIGNRTTNAGDFFSRGAVYTQTSANGSSWSLVHGSMAQHTVLNLGLAATTEANGTPVAAFGLNNSLYFHEGIDPNAPASSSDGVQTGPIGTGLESPALARDKDGSIWLAWFQLFGTGEGYYVERILPSKAALRKAPNSGGGANADSDPRQQVALAARPGGGVFLAYCSPTKVRQCAHINLWKVGSARPMIVPGSGTGNAGRVALAAGPGGRLTVAWFDFGQNKIHVIRTNTAATKFGAAHTVKAPPKTILFNGLAVDASSGRQDIVANVTLTTPPNPVVFFHTQVLASLKLSAKPGSFSHRSAVTVTFTVTDVGNPVAGARVSCIGKSGTTNAQGQVKLTFGRGTSSGGHSCKATKGSYAPGKTTLKVT